MVSDVMTKRVTRSINVNTTDLFKWSQMFSLSSWKQVEKIAITNY